MEEIQEFQESEVVWPHHHHHHHHHHRESCTSLEYKWKGVESRRARPTRPISIPKKRVEKLRSKFDDYEDEAKMVPPHEILARRLSGKMGFSVCIGNGRTLKGRDLRKVRNGVLGLTGFLESC